MGSVNVEQLLNEAKYTDIKYENVNMTAVTMEKSWTTVEITPINKRKLGRAQLDTLRTPSTKGNNSTRCDYCNTVRNFLQPHIQLIANVPYENNKMKKLQ